MVSALHAHACAPLALTLLVALTLPATAQHHPGRAEVRSIAEVRTEAEVVEAVRAHNLALQAAHARAEAEAERPAQVRWPFPMVEAMAMPQMLAMGEPGVSLMVRQTIPQPGRLRADRNAREAMARAASLGADALEREQVRLAREAYAELWGVQERAARIDSFQAGLAVYREVALGQLRAGRGPQQAVLAIQLEAERLAQQLDAFDEEAHVLVARLAALTGGTVWIGSLGALAPPPARVQSPPEADPGATFDAHPTVAAEAAMQEAEAAEARMRRTMLRPEFTLGAALNLSSDARAGRYGQDVITPSVGVMLPLWRGGVRAEVREAEARARERALAAEHAFVTLSAEAEGVREALGRTRERIVRYETTLRPVARQTLDVSLSGYRAATAPFLSLLDAQRMALDVELDLVEAHVREAILVASLDALTP